MIPTPTLAQLQKAHALAKHERDQLNRVANDPTRYMGDRVAAARVALDYGAAAVALAQMIRDVVAGASGAGGVPSRDSFHV